MTQKTSQSGTQKKNKGGRPRKDGKSTRGSTSITWKRISRPVSTHHYEVSSAGQVRRRLKSGEYYDLKPWVTGGPYAAVYLAGIKGATRGRKKCYIHRLVADHFVSGKSKAKVVHHEVGPHSNTARTLKWVTPSENSKARKYFNDDGSRKSKSQKVKIRAPSQKPTLKDARESAPVTVKRAIMLLYKNSATFKKAFKVFLKNNKSVNQKNFADKFNEATGKALKLGATPESWYKVLMSAMAEIERRLETSE